MYGLVLFVTYFKIAVVPILMAEEAAISREFSTISSLSEISPTMPSVNGTPSETPTYESDTKLKYGSVGKLSDELMERNISMSAFWEKADKGSKSQRNMNNRVIDVLSGIPDKYINYFSGTYSKRDLLM